MTVKLRGVVQHKIEPGQLILIRAMKASLAEAALANAVAPAIPYQPNQHYVKGDFIIADALEDLGGRDLHAIAAGPIMEPLKVYLPAGRLSESEYQQRLTLDFARINEPPPNIGPRTPNPPGNPPPSRAA